LSEKPVAELLLVEDEDQIRLLLAEVFRIENFRVYTASDGEEALRVFDEHRNTINMMITDLGLPNLGGVDLISRVRQLRPDIKIIGSSGYGRSNIREEVLGAGGDEFIPKPYVTTELLRTVRHLLGLAQTGERSTG
jgi:DNA-binding response OmpR family regulator